MSSVTTTEGPATRMKADARRELVLEAATRVFGERGYFGATTDAIAREAGISQPYILRIFGTKETLFVEVLQRALDRLMGAFHRALAGEGPQPPSGATTVEARLATAYAELLADRGLLLSLMHGFILGSDPVIGACARKGFIAVYRFLREEAGMSAVQATDFLAHGMQLNTLVGIRMSLEYERDATAKEMLDTMLPTKVGSLLALDAERGA